MKKFSNQIAQHSRLIVILAVLLLIPAIWGYMKTRINYDILVYLPKDIETVEGQNVLTEKFGVGAFSFVMTDKSSSVDLLTLERKIKDIEHVNMVMSIADLTDVMFPLDMLPEEILEKVYKDGKTAIIVTFDTSTSEESTIEAIDELRDIVGDASSVSGMTAMVLDTMNLSNSEMLIYIVLAVIFCSLVLLVVTNSYLIPIFLLGNIGCAIIYNMGTNVFLGEISYITQAITAVLQLGVTMDFSIFLYHKYEDIKKEESDKKRAMARAIEETFKSVIGSSLTTIAGFLALCGMNLTLGRDIGLVMAKGVVCGLITVLSLFPALLLVFDRGIEATKHKTFLPKFKGLQKFVTKHSIPIVSVFVLLAIPAIIGNNNVEVYYKLDNSLPEDLPCRIANTELAEKFGIVSPEMILLSDELSAQKTAELASELREIDGVDLVLAPSVLEKDGILLDMLPEDLLKIFEQDGRQLVILNSTYEVASDELNTQIDEINRIIKNYDENAILAGEGALTKDLVEIAEHDFLIVNYISIAVIFVLMLIVLKSLSLPAVLVIVIEFAIFANMAIACFTKTSLPFIASIVVGTIQLGATIDYAILMSTTYLTERKALKDKKKAMMTTLDKTVNSIVVSALCFFCATWGVALYSKIDMIGSICQLLSRGALISMVTVVCLLPTLLLIFDKLIMKTTKGMKGSI